MRSVTSSRLGMFIVTLAAQSWAQQSDATTIYSKYSKSVLLIFVKSADTKIVSQGTGFLVSGGKIVTNQHVIVGGTPLLDLGGVRIPATVESVDDLNDLAILTVTAEISAEPLELSDKTPSPGSNVFAIGNPRGLEKTISTGVLSGVRTVGRRELLQITTPISHGSSGGPVFDSSGKVIGVTVSSIEDGQNLNFAIPASAVIKLLRGQALISVDFSTLVENAKMLVGKRESLQYSNDADSPYQKNQREIVSVFSSAVERAGKTDVAVLIQLSNDLANFYPDDRNVAVLAAERAVRLAPSADSDLALAKALNVKATFMGEAEVEQQKVLLERSEKAARQAIASAKQPSAEMFYWLGDGLEMRNLHQPADIALRRALELNRATSDANQQGLILRNLISAAVGLKHADDIDHWFSSLVTLGEASQWDWGRQAQRLDAGKRFAEAGESWQKAAQFDDSWTDWCEAAGSFELASDKEDSTLFAGRKCIALGAGKPKSELQLSQAHRAVAAVLNGRGVFEESLSHAKEATVLGPDDAHAYDEQAVALLGLRRNQEAINAAKAAIRLSDGKYGLMHFHLGSAYFEAENWQFARQSFEKAAELRPSDDAAAYNVALCLQRMSVFLDAAHWYEEVLRRNPNHRDKQEILNRITVLRK
ncbi:MAG: tetratricopeptide repeat-containing serine protease family protein [Candidatus Solibacter sp.]